MNRIEQQTGRVATRRDLLRAAAGTAILGSIGGLTGTAAAATPTTARSGTVSGNVFLGGDFLELGILPNGGFGASVTAPTEFFGSQRTGGIGMYADFDGFANDATDFQYDYFLPGTPEERFSVGYKDAAGNESTASNGRVVGDNIPTSVTDTSSGDSLSAEVSSEFDGVLQIDQTIKFLRENQFYTIDVTLENVGSETLYDVRYQRSVDPDNGKDVGCSYTTKNTVVDQFPSGSRALVKAEIRDGDSCAIAEFSTIPMFYQSTDARARVSYGNFGLVPSSPPYGTADYENAPAAGSTVTTDAYIAITYAFGDLEPGETVTATMATGLTGDIDRTLEEVEGPAPDEADRTPRPARFKIVEGSVTPKRVDIGEPVTATATVRNVGDRGGTYTARFQDDTDLFGVERVRLEPDAEHSFEFTVTYDDIGRNRLLISEWSLGEVRVVRPQAPNLDESDMTVLEAYVTRENVEPRDRFEVVATVRNDADTEGNAPVVFRGSPTEPGGVSVEATRRVRLSPGGTTLLRHEVRVPGRTATDYEQLWTVNGTEAGTVSVTVPEDAFAGGGDGIIDTYLTESSVAPGESYGVVGVVRNGTNETNTYGVAFRRGGTLERVWAVRLAPGERETVTLTVRAPDTAGRTIDWSISSVPVGRVTVE